ncbi:hypothetical protein GH714_012546 [Hevea brasiliensis]|uniref:Disease resistance protein At4g27190-like leucine-rich repeats domain-containing protein n=1 Tax=Hevea brasiliensis TaxID=3981 RepID=A0A6A6L344_HEVBR|nr:hypothetical protein GH714_012546 [Hevea brasiliensis]
MVESKGDSSTMYIAYSGSMCNFDIPVPANLLQFLNKLEKLQVEYCDSAEIVFDLEGLSVDDGHTELLPQLTLCLMQLEEIKLSNCNTIEEIIEKEGPEEATSSADKMILPSLKFVDLECLPKFSSFYSGSSNLECLSLKKLSIYECPSMKNVFGTLVRLHRPNTNDEGREQRLDNEGFDTPLTTPFCHKLRIFTAGVSSTPKLRVYGRLRYRKWHWEGNLNATIEQLYMKCTIDEVQLSNFPMLKEKWHGQFPFKNLKHLRKLVVDDCAFFSNAVSSNLLKYLFLSNQPVISYPKANELVVERCDSVEELFDLEGLNADEGDVGLLKYLNELRLIDLPRLRHVWKRPQGILSFKNLTLLQVQNCSSLTNIFTLSMASGLVNLQHMELKRCCLVEHIITKAEEEIAKDKIMFPSMKSISLECLPNLSSFYSARDFLKCPSLKRIDMVAIPSLEELRVEYNTMKDMWSQADFLSGLKGIELTCFSTLLPSYFFQSLPDLEKLVLSDASFEEIIFHEEIISKETRAGLVKLKELKLSKLPRLKHLMDAKLLTVFQYLETLEVLECGRLEILVPSSVSFQNLKTLEEVQSESQMAERTTTQEYYVEDTHTSQTHFQLVLRLPAAAKLWKF